ncbi:protein serine/threonine phosphatase 2C [Ramicandelaber brevisporus]|nr:protein serine/threonine phosphatase 2C [Ramicandelaber brevisporus]
MSSSTTEAAVDTATTTTQQQQQQQPLKIAAGTAEDLLLPAQPESSSGEPMAISPGHQSSLDDSTPPSTDSATSTNMATFPSNSANSDMLDVESPPTPLLTESPMTIATDLPEDTPKASIASVIAAENDQPLSSKPLPRTKGRGGGGGGATAAARYNSQDDDSTNSPSQNSQPGPTEPGTVHMAAVSDRNRRYRRTMEDAHNYLYDYDNVPGQCYFGVFDGHAGKFAAEWSAANVHEILLNCKREMVDEMASEQQDTQPLPSDDKETSAVESTEKSNQVNSSDRPQNLAALPLQPLLHRTFLQCDTTMAQVIKSQSGCTAVVGLITVEDAPDSSSTSAEADSSVAKQNSERCTPCGPSKIRKLAVANVGDGRAVLCRGGRAFRLTYDHKAEDPVENVRVREAGGYILNNRVSGVLAVTRSLGDKAMKHLVIGAPYTSETVLTPDDEFVIVACDGLWDVCKDQKAVDLIRNVQDAHAASNILLKHALHNETQDNITIMVVRINH